MIVDANQASLVFCQKPSADHAPVLEWIRHKGMLVLGGRLTEELARCGVSSFIAELNRAGRAHVVAPDVVAKHENAAAGTGRMRSDDAHVVALVVASKARTVCTRDGELIKDLKDRMLVPRPAVGIYKQAQHVHLLRHSVGCPGRSAS